MSVLFSLFGIVALLGCAFLLSESRSSINWKTVSRALLLQLGFAALVLYFPMGQAALASLSNGVAGLLSFADEGIRFLLVISLLLVSSSLFASFLSSFSSALLSLPFTTWASCKSNSIYRRRYPEILGYQ